MPKHKQVKSSVQAVLEGIELLAHEVLVRSMDDHDMDNIRDTEKITVHVLKALSQLADNHDEIADILAAQDEIREASQAILANEGIQTARLHASQMNPVSRRN